MFVIILVRIFPHFSAFVLNTDPYSIRMREYAGKMRTRITPNRNIFYAVYHSRFYHAKQNQSAQPYPELLRYAGMALGHLNPLIDNPTK